VLICSQSYTYGEDSYPFPVVTGGCGSCLVAGVDFVLWFG
jgi:hypothetical protein